MRRRSRHIEGLNSAPVVISGAASGMGSALRMRLERAGVATFGIDREAADLTVDLEHTQQRADALARLAVTASHGLSGLATFAGVSGHSGVPGSTVVSVDYFGSVELFEAARPLLAMGPGGPAVAVGSIGAVVHPGVAEDLVEACLAHDEPRARALADEIGPSGAYVAAKLALGRWVRRNAPKQEWIGAGVRLNLIMPGLVLTPLVTEAEGRPSGRARLGEFNVPAGRPGQPEDVAALAEFLMGPQSEYIVGSVITIDGGSEAAAVPDAWPAAIS